MLLLSACAAPPRADPRPIPPASPGEPEPEPEADAPAPGAPRPIPQSGHTSEVWRLAFSPDGRFLASGGLDHAVLVWSLDGQVVAELLGHQEAIMGLSWRPDGGALVSNARDGRIIVWDLDTAAPAQVIRKGVFAVAWSPDGLRLATVGPQADVTLFSPLRGELLERAATPGHEGRQLLDLAYSPSGERIATRALDGHVHVWDGRSLAIVAKGHLASGYERRLVFSPRGDRIAAGHGDALAIVDATTGQVQREIKSDNPFPIAWTERGITSGGGAAIHVVDPDSGKAKKKIGNLGIVEAAAQTPNGELVATAHDVDSQIRLWRLEGGVPVAALGSTRAGAGVARFSPDGTKIVTAGAALDVWDATQGRIAARLTSTETGAAEWSPDGALLAADTERAIAIWQTDGKKVATLPAHSDNYSTHFAWKPDGSALAVALEKTLRIWSRADKRVTPNLKLGDSHAADVAWSPDGKLLAVGGYSKAELWDTKSWRVVRTLDVKLLKSWASLRHLIFAPDGKRIALVSDQDVGLFDVASGRLEAKTEGRALFAVPSFSPDSRRLAFSGKDRSVVLWDGARTMLLDGAEGPVRVVAFSPDGSRVAAASDDAHVRVWSLRTGRVEREFSGHEGRVWSMSWHPSGRVLVASSHHSRLHRMSDGRSLTLRARTDAPAGMVHTGAGQFDGDPEAFSLLRFRSGSRFARATLLDPAEAARTFHQPGLAAEFWKE